MPSLLQSGETDSERVVLGLLESVERDGAQSQRRIAADMYLSPATVRSHVRNAMVKTGAHTRAQLVAIVLGEGLVGDQP